MLKITIVIFTILGSLLLATAFAENDILLEAAKKYETHGMSGSVFISDTGNQLYLVSVGFKDVASDNPNDILNARKVAKTAAKRGLSKFIHNTKVTSNETIKSDIRSIVTYKNNKLVKLERSEQLRYDSIIAEKGEGALNKIIEVGSWKFENSFFLVLAIKIDKN